MIAHANSPDAAKRLLTVPECATYIGSTPLNIYQMVSKGQIPYVKIGRSTRFDLRELDTWIDRLKHGRTSHLLRAQ